MNRFCLFPTAVLMAAAGILRADTSASAPRNTLFLGADLQITYQGGLYHVNQVDRGYFVITVDGRDVRVAPNPRAGIGIKMNRQLRLAPFAAQIDRWKAERAYAIGSDPEMVAAVEFGEQRDIEAAAESFARAQIDQAEGQFDFAGMAARAPGTLGEITPARRGTDVAVERYKSEAYKGLANQQATSNSNLTLSGSQAWKNAHAEGGATPYDAIRIDFDVSSPRPLQQPYVVLVGVFHDLDRPKAKHIWVGARDLDPIGTRPQAFHLLQDGFPKGFELEKVSVHLYDRGSEIATNLADQRMELSRDETFSFLLTEYIQRHKGATLPATLAMTTVPPDWHDRIRSGAYAGTVFVRVGKDGRPAGVYLDRDGTRPVADDYLSGVVMKIRFRPALAQGKPVAAIVPLVPMSLLR